MKNTIWYWLWYWKIGLAVIPIWHSFDRSSGYGYTSFHECCDDKGPTLVSIKSDKGWIFVGYATQSWSGKVNNTNRYVERRF